MNTTKTTQFTPGPWVAALGERLNTDVYHIDKQGNRVFVAEFATQTDAVLSAAAPAMYEALRKVIEHRAKEYLDNTIEPYCSLVAALAQAEGRHHE